MSYAGLNIAYKVQMIEMGEQPCSDRKYHMIAARMNSNTGLLSRMPVNGLAEWTSELLVSGRCEEEEGTVQIAPVSWFGFSAQS